MARKRGQHRRMLDARIRRVLRWLDAEPDAARITEYRLLAVEEHGSLEAALDSDEREMSDSRGR